MSEKKQEEKQEEKPVIQMFAKDVDVAASRQKKYVNSMKDLQRALRAAGDIESANEAEALWKEAEAAPVETFRDKNILWKMWHTLKELFHWVKALLIGTLKWGLHCLITAIKLVEHALNDFGECFTSILA